MFNNLIESSSHAMEFKRRGSFVMITAVTYFLLFAIAGVASIYAYDAHLEEPDTDMIVTMLPAEPAPPQPERTVSSTPPKGNSNQFKLAQRREPMASVNTPQLTPEKTSAAPNLNPPVPDRGSFTVGPDNSEAEGPGGPGKPGGNHGSPTGGNNVPIVEVATPPTPPVVEKVKPRTVHRSIVNSLAISLPKPPYPALAKKLGIEGTVSVQVLIDETGRVVSAKTVSGSALLATAAQQAALNARFSPTMLDEQRVKVSGVITYNFVLAR